MPASKHGGGTLPAPIGREDQEHGTQGQRIDVGLSCHDKRRIGKALDGTCSSGQHLAERYNVSLDEITLAANEAGVVQCLACSFWVDDRDLDQDGRCNNCQIA